MGHPVYIYFFFSNAQINSKETLLYTVLQMFRQFCLFPEGGNEGGRVATPTNFLMFDFYDIKSLI